jgi:hypothetical protein
MCSHVFLRPARSSFPFLLLVVCTTSGPVARADVVLLKDGFTLHGKVKREMQTLTDPGSGQMVEMAKLNGFFMVDDEARRLIFSARQVDDVTDTDVNRESDPVRLERRFTRVDFWRLPPLVQFAGVTDWDEKWGRTFRARGPEGRVDIVQRLTLLTPQVARIEAIKYAWAGYFLTREFDPKTLRTLLGQHPELKATGSGDDAAKRYRIYRFFVQAGFYDQAEEELAGILKDFPDQKEKIETSRENLKKLRTLELLDDIERAHKAGRHQWVYNRLAASEQFTEGLEEKLLARVGTLKTLYEKMNEELILARRVLRELPARLGGSDPRAWLREATAAITAELHADALPRLEAFLRLAQQAERDRQQGRTPEHGPDQLLALAVSGWLLGSGSAEANVATAERLWRARQFVLDYQKTHDDSARRQMLQPGPGLPFDELAQLIRFLPPPEPLPSWSLVGAYLSAGSELAAGHGPPALAACLLPNFYHPLSTARWLTFEVNLPWQFRKGTTYLVRPPPEYHPSRPCPVLFALHGAGEKPEDMLQRFGYLAALHGYLLVAPDWQRGVSGGYGYTADEHAAVLDVLRDLRRRFQVDSDRVFLAGWAEGGNMAYDVGLAHPDQFAGVLPLAARPRYFARAYWRNAQYLPFYVVDGDSNGDSFKDNRLQFRDWVPRGYPALYVEYRGRGQEWFAAELPFLFDWMSRKKRVAAFPELGRSGTGGAFGEEFCSMRPTDNRFYWLSADGLSNGYINDSRKWKTQPAAALQARIANSNQISVHVRGFKQVTVWLGQGMIDFDKPVTIYVSSRVRWANRKVEPNLGTLLEDFYLRGDRQRLFWAKVDITLAK